MYPRGDIDKAREGGETRAVEPELRDVLDQLAADLRGEIRSGDAETRTYFGERIGTSTAELCRHIDVVGESLRGEICGLAEALALNNEGTQRQIGEWARRTDRLEGRVLRLEGRVTNLEGSRKPPKRLRQQ
jgi:hypothetical protein